MQDITRIVASIYGSTVNTPCWTNPCNGADPSAIVFICPPDVSFSRFTCNPISQSCNFTLLVVGGGCKIRVAHSHIRGQHLLKSLTHVGHIAPHAMDVTITTIIILILTLYLGIAHIKDVQALVYQPEFKNVT